MWGDLSEMTSPAAPDAFVFQQLPSSLSLFISRALYSRFFFLIQLLRFKHDEDWGRRKRKWCVFGPT
jgi:hypothetical protein